MIQYLIKATVLLSISYIAFRIIYNKGTGFGQQRIFLLSVLVFSLILPLTGVSIKLSALLPEARNVTGYSGIVNESYYLTQVSGQEGSETNTPVILLIYSVVSALLIAMLIAHFLKILRIYNRSESKKIGRNIILSSHVIESPFSFFRWIFIPEVIPEGEEKESIIIHENIHATQYHSADNLLIELIAAVMWFNPLVWLIKRQLHLIHEYLADEGTVGSGIDRLRYQAFLINQVAEENLILLSSSFNQSLIKKRMIMMTKNKSKSERKVRFLALIPIFFMFIGVTALLNGFFPKDAAAGDGNSTVFTIEAKDPVVVKEIQKDTLIRKKGVAVRQVKNDVDAGQDKNEIKVIGYGSMKNDSLIYVVDGTHVADISKLDPNSIESVNVMKEDNLIIIHTKKPNAPKVVISEDGNKFSTVPDNLIVIIDGKNSDKNSLRTLDPNDIESMSVLKGEEATKKYGNKSADGVIIITTKIK